jgi:hypothetical protein
MHASLGNCPYVGLMLCMYAKGASFLTPIENVTIIDHWYAFMLITIGYARL